MTLEQLKPGAVVRESLFRFALLRCVLGKGASREPSIRTLRNPVLLRWQPIAETQYFRFAQVQHLAPYGDHAGGFP